MYAQLASVASFILVSDVMIVLLIFRAWPKSVKKAPFWDY